MRLWSLLTLGLSVDRFDADDLDEVDRFDDAGADQVVAREDAGELMSVIRKDEDGSLHLNGYAARAGILLYPGPNGTVIRELVPPETLKASAPSLKRAAVTLRHPDRKKHANGFVTPKNIAELGVGDVDSNVVVHDEGELIEVNFSVRRDDAIASVESRETPELSPGYKAGLSLKSGVHPVHGPYDQIQISRRYNHLALVPRGRGGRQVRYRLDADEDNQKPPEYRMNPLIVAALLAHGLQGRFDDDNAALKAIADAARARADGEGAELTKLKAEISKLTGERDAAVGRADAAEVETKRLRKLETDRADAADRSGLEELAKTNGIDPAKHPVTRDLRVAIASAFVGEEVKADASDEYLTGLLAGARKAAGATTTNRADGAGAWGDLAGGGQNAGGNTPAADQNVRLDAAILTRNRKKKPDPYGGRPLGRDAAGES
jgi:hypothetical protein